MEIENLSQGGFAANSYLVTNGSDAVLIDATASVQSVRATLAKKGATLHAILLTHGHFDHLLTADALRDAFGVPLLVHQEDAHMLLDGEKNASLPFLGRSITITPAEKTFVGGNFLRFGDIDFLVLHTPGHSRGSSVFRNAEAMFTGDTLFAEGYGRTDLYGGDANAMHSSLSTLFRYDSQLRIYPGHGENVLLHHAKKHLLYK
jgi:glyoxylase-like metal-dependent hydrolase (beta-lactamase superfamily II)